MLVRHGQSEYNARVRAPASWLSLSFWRNLGCTGIRDASLTSEGVDQALCASALLAAELSGRSRVHFLASPLTRAIETGRLMMREREESLLLLPSLRERRLTLADCGKEVQALKASFEGSELGFDTETPCSGAEGLPLGAATRRSAGLPMDEASGTWSCSSRVKSSRVKDSKTPLDFSLLEADAIIASGREWWKEEKAAGARESESSVSARVRVTKRFLLKRFDASESDQIVVLFGHSLFWQEFLWDVSKHSWLDRLLRRKVKLKNCQIAYCELGEDLSVENVRYMPEAEPVSQIESTN